MRKMALYMNKAQAGRTLGMDRGTVLKLVRGMQDQIEKGRYSKYVVAGRLINMAALLDYIKYKDMLNCNLAKYVPAFDEVEAARCLGEQTG